MKNRRSLKRVRGGAFCLLVAGFWLGLEACGWAGAGLPRATPESQGLSSAVIRSLVGALDREAGGLHSFLLVRHGRVVAEGWWSPEAADRPHIMWSLTKSFTSTAVGLAIAEGKLDPDDRVLGFFPALAPADPSDHLRAMRVRDLLTMTCGHEKETRAWDQEESWVKIFLAHPVPHPPGSRFTYNTMGSHMLSVIVQQVTGETVADYLQPRLFDPLGIEPPKWLASPAGESIGGYGLYLRTDDIARFGQLYLQRGAWNGRQILPASWVAEATAKQVPNDDNPDPDWNQGYGFQFWRCRHNAYRGDGKDGQYCIVLPDQDAVIAITAEIGNMQKPLDLIWEHLLPAFHETSLPENPSAVAALQAALAGLTADSPTVEEAKAPTLPAGEPVALWPGVAPGETGDIGPEHDTTKADGNLVAGRRVARIGNVSEPTLTVFRPPPARDTGAAVVVCPGGGYHILASDLEGTEVCEWLNGIGVTGILLEYRVPRREGREKHDAPLQDVQRAMGLVRANAVTLGIDPNRIGVLGFSAGGHLAAAAATHRGGRSYPRVDADDNQSARPDFAVLVYPGYLTTGDDLRTVSPELTISEATPPTFLVVAGDDSPGMVQGTLHYASALRDAKVPFELHVYPTGGHGYGLRPSDHAVTTWPTRVEDWMRRRGLLDPSPEQR